MHNDRMSNKPSTKNYTVGDIEKYTSCNMHRDISDLKEAEQVYVENASKTVPDVKLVSLRSFLNALKDDDSGVVQVAKMKDGNVVLVMNGDTIWQ